MQYCILQFCIVFARYWVIDNCFACKAKETARQITPVYRSTRPFPLNHKWIDWLKCLCYSPRFYFI